MLEDSDEEEEQPNPDTEKVRALLASSARSS